MTATLESLKHLGSRMWRASASSTEDSPTFRYYYRGDLLRETEDDEIDFRAFGGEVPHVEVFDDADTVPEQRKHPGRIELRWYHAPDGLARRFDIERESSPGSGSWSVISRVQQTGRGHYRYRTDWLDDVTTHSYRVRAVDDAGNKATAAEMEALVVRHPTVPRWTATRESGGTVTLEEG